MSLDELVPGDVEHPDKLDSEYFALIARPKAEVIQEAIVVMDRYEAWISPDVCKSSLMIGGMHLRRQRRLYQVQGCIEQGRHRPIETRSTLERDR
jgi:hypothetical protein